MLRTDTQNEREVQKKKRIKNGSMYFLLFQLYSVPENDSEYDSDNYDMEAVSVGS